MKKWPYMLFISAALLGVNGAWADNAAKIQLVKKIHKEGQFLKYADPELKKIARQGDKIARQVDELGCEMVEHYYLGESNGDLNDSPAIQKHKVTVMPNGWVRSRYMFHGVEPRDIRFDLACTGKRCVVRDVVNRDVFTDDGHQGSFKRRFQYIIKHKRCPAWT
ncbi:hypothetical protein L1281_000975 [Neisseria sp. HSC-16F19]|nr:hypothetical protein [Neisseria sp. HSC-16F19]MCP2040392.1 hypothetical protein [Neisseria sp. HSC-16F19]